MPANDKRSDVYGGRQKKNRKKDITRRMIGSEGKMFGKADKPCTFLVLWIMHFPLLGNADNKFSSVG